MSQDEVLRLVARAKDEISGPLAKIRTALRALKDSGEGPAATRKAFIAWNKFAQGDARPYRQGSRGVASRP